MSEFVEEGIEGLLPVFETLRDVQLLSPTEIDAFVKRCQFFEYRLHKPRKDSISFKGYSNYLESIMKLIRMRRKRIKYKLLTDEIEGRIAVKIANLLHYCCERFQGRMEGWYYLIDFLKAEKMYKRCSKAYFRALQIFPRDSTLRIHAAKFEYSVENRIECARAIMQEGIRLNPTECSLWTNFVLLELDHVKWLITRRSILTGKECPSCTEEKELQDAGEVQKNKEIETTIKENDAILGLRVVETIINAGLERCCSCQSELLLNFWRNVKKYGLVGQQLAENLYDKLWTSKYKSEESWIAKSELEKSDRLSLYCLLDSACDDIPTEKMHRYYLTLCQSHYSLDHDPVAKEKFREQLFWLIKGGYGTNEDIRKFNLLVENSEEKEKVLNEMLKNSQDNAYLWLILLQCKIKSNSMDIEAIRQLFNKATRAASDESHDLTELYKVAIDWAHQYAENHVEDFFKRATFNTASIVACEMRCVRLKYLASVYPEEPMRRRDEYFLFAKHPPNSLEVHQTVIKLELESEQKSVEFVVRAFEFMILEFGKTTHCWIDYANFMLKHDPNTLQTIHRRATTSLVADEVEPFLEAYGSLLQNAASIYTESGCDTKEKIDTFDFIESAYSNKSKRPRISSKKNQLKELDFV